MTRWLKRAFATAVIVMTATACATLGGPSPVEYTAVALDAGDATPAQLAAQLQETGADVALVRAAREDAWFAQLATASGLELSGPARRQDVALGFLSSLELLGDTTIAVPLEGDDMLMQDALYQVADERYLDMMFVRVPDGADLPVAARALYQYIATDVMADAALVLGVSTGTPAEAREMERLLRAAFAYATECGGIDGAEQSTYRVFFGPVARVRCVEARRLAGAGSPIVVRISVGLER